MGAPSIDVKKSSDIIWRLGCIIPQKEESCGGGEERGLRRKLQLDKNLRPDVNAMKSELQTSPSVLADTPPLPQRPDVPNSNTSRHSHSSIFLKDDGIRFNLFFFGKLGEENDKVVKVIVCLKFSFHTLCGVPASVNISSF